MNCNRAKRLSIIASGLLTLFIMGAVFVSTSAAQMKAFSRDVMRERSQFRALLLMNPNYFGNLKTSELRPVKVINNNTSYEELTCVGYNPPLKRLEAVIHVKSSSGYGGGICSGGTREYIRFYVDWNNDGNWADAGMTSFMAYNITSDKALEYAVTINLDPTEKFCTVEYLPKVRGILSWNNPPPAGNPNFVPIWGNVMDARIQIDKARILLVKDFLELAEIKVSDQILSKVDLTQEIPTIEPQPLSLNELQILYEDKDVPAHRFGFSHLKKLLIKPMTMVQPEPVKQPMMMMKSQPSPTGEMAPSVAMMAPDVAAMPVAEININVVEALAELLKTDGNTGFEELNCVGLNPNQDTLTGVFTVKRPNGFSGNLCTQGSQEYVAFWEWDQIEQMWLYLGTATVNTHDLQNTPSDGLKYSVFLPYDTGRHRRPCTYGPVLVKIRAILSWQTPPPPTNPNWAPTWGNRVETLVHIQPGPYVIERVPYIDTVGNMAVCDIDQNTGLASGTGVIAAFTADDSPFGGTITITGFVTNAPNVMENPASAVRYKLFVRQYEPGMSDSENPWQPLNNKFQLTVTEQIGSGLPKQKKVMQKIDSQGYYAYLEDMKPPDWRYVAGRVLGKWVTGASMSGKWEIRLEADIGGGTIVQGGTISCPDGSTRSMVRLRLDNVRPDPGVAITSMISGSGSTPVPAGDCGKFKISSTINGDYSVADKHFGALTLTVRPSGPAHGATVSPSYRAYSTVPTTGESGTWSLNTTGMDPCGYIVHLWVRDRTIVNSGSIGWRNGADVGFCLEH